MCWPGPCRLQRTHTCCSPVHQVAPGCRVFLRCDRVSRGLSVTTSGEPLTGSNAPTLAWLSSVPLTLPDSTLPRLRARPSLKAGFSTLYTTAARAANIPTPTATWGAAFTRKSREDGLPCAEAETSAKPRADAVVTAKQAAQAARVYCSGRRLHTVKLGMDLKWRLMNLWAHEGAGAHAGRGDD